MWYLHVSSIRVVIGLACLVVISAAIALEPDQLYAKVSRGVVIVMGIDASNAKVSQGSGIVIAIGEIITNCHVVDGMLYLVVKQGNQVSKAHVRFEDKERDLCQLTMDGETKIGTPVAGIVSYTDLRVGQRVYAVGAPQGLELTISDGLIAQLRRTTKAELIQTTAPVSPGSSGGGLFDADGRLLGITTFILREGQNLNFAIPANWILELPARHAQQQGATRNRITEAEQPKREVGSESPTFDVGPSDNRQIGLTILPFAGEERFIYRMSQIIGADLQKSGLFKLGAVGAVPPFPSRPSEINYRQWENKGAEVLVVGSVDERADRRVDVSFRLMDVLKQSQVLGFSYTITIPQMRPIAHKIADLIYGKLTGAIGIFSTRICFVSKKNDRVELRIADSDGYNSQFILAHNEAITSPQWSPDGTRIAYVSFERKKPIVFVHNLLDATRIVLANYEGSNLAPAWSPNGRKLALVLTKDGLSQIYMVNPDGSGLERVTDGTFNNGEPSFSKDGRKLLFTSDRLGTPQIFEIPLHEKDSLAKRVTVGERDTSAEYSPDGRRIVFVRWSGRESRIATQELQTGEVHLLTAGESDHSPHFSPDGRLILYASDVKGRSILAVISSDGRMNQRIAATSGDLSEPAWGPL